ncbi:PP2C family protein-serine/threonine phosphatase [Oceanidesulfovibrio marinus]|uniref:Cyclic nucleotide-binding protein n=1 Tax=Oceanidesulfovibrio marinus TaxID=370038 RepID=A0A6P1ZQK6_9BACT|nr:GAF domain-containing SpoIIE family protein phosphatase [Oceanidesulfovibrio marinus]TVM36757.1 cyclic nucleotide-binding protein [Oceanidesulfovibrio marinus]
MPENPATTEFFSHSSPDVAFRRIENLLKASQSLVRIESIELLLPSLLEMAKDVTNAEAASILLFNPESEELCFYHAIDPDPDAAPIPSDVCHEYPDAVTLCGAGCFARLFQHASVSSALSSIRLRLGEGIAGSVARERRAVLVRDARSDPRFSPRADAVTGFTTRNLICAPLLYQDELLGVIEVLNALDRESFVEEDVKVLECFACLAAESLQRAALLNARVAQKALEAQLEAAAAIQSSFLPHLGDTHGGVRAWGVTRPARFVGGDLYDVMPLPDGTGLAYVADVSGKGLPASLIMAAAWAQVRAEANRTPEPGPLLERVNNALVRTLERQAHFVTIVICRYGLPGGLVQLASGGHPAPLLAGPDGVAELERTNSLPLGIEEDTPYPMTEFVIEPGGSLLLFSDGLFEAEDTDGAMLGMQRVLNALAGATPPLGEPVLEIFETFTRGAEAADDLTILELSRVSA